MITLSIDELKSILTMPAAIDLVDKAMITTSKGGATLPLRTAMPLDAPNMLGSMPGALSDPPCFGTKLISLYPGNPEHGHSSHLGLMVLFEREFGTPTALMDAGILTAMRTAAASAVATRALARQDATVLAIIGTGEQALFHVASITAVRDITELRLAGRTPERAQEFAQKVSRKYPDLKVVASKNAQEAVRGADIVCTVTSSRETVLQGAWIDAGTHVNAVGASIPIMREIDEDMVVQASLFVDYRPSVLVQAKDVIEAIKAGKITEDHIVAEIGEVLDGKSRGRETAEEITLYRSMGVAAQDLICAHFVMEQAKKLGIGVEVSIS